MQPSRLLYGIASQTSLSERRRSLPRRHPTHRNQRRFHRGYFSSPTTPAPIIGISGSVLLSVSQLLRPFIYLSRHTCNRNQSPARLRLPAPTPGITASLYNPLLRWLYHDQPWCTVISSDKITVVINSNHSSATYL